MGGNKIRFSVAQLVAHCVCSAEVIIGLLYLTGNTYISKKISLLQIILDKNAKCMNVM